MITDRPFTQIVPNLRQKLIDACQFDPEFKRFWVKHVTGVDWTKKTGFAYAGEFLEDGDKEVDAILPHLYIIAATTEKDGYYPPRKKANFRGEYRFIYESHMVLQLNPDLSIMDMGLRCDDPDRWAVAIRDQVEMHLKRLALDQQSSLAAALDHLAHSLGQFRDTQPHHWTSADVGAIMVLMDLIDTNQKGETV